MREVCAEHQVLFLDVFGLLENEDLDDGLHPNVRGHEKLFQRIKDFLLDNRII